jgi:hypothetical protein
MFVNNLQINFTPINFLLNERPTSNKRHCREQVKLRFLFIFPGRCPGLLYSGLSARSIAKQLDYLKLDVERSMLDVLDLFVLLFAFNSSSFNDFVIK